MTDNRTKNSHPAGLWDYRRAKMLLDILATDTNGIVNSEWHKMELIKHLCAIWDVPMIVDREGKMNLLFTLERLAQYALEHGREEYQARKIESEKE